MTSQSSRPDADEGREQDTSEATSLPVASQEILSKLVSTTVGLEDPRTGNIVVMLQLHLPPLIPGGLEYMQSLAAYFKPLGLAVAQGRVAILEDEPASELRAAPLGLEGEETAAEHLRNALQIVVSYAVRAPGDPQRTLVSYADLNAMESRLTAALEQLDEPTVPLRTKNGRTLHVQPNGARTALTFRSAAQAESCIHCGCTDVTPCDLNSSELSQSDRRVLREYFAELGEALPKVVPCWWIWADEPVCSNPACQAKNAAAVELEGR